jgi:hypothetical protein
MTVKWIMTILCKTLIQFYISNIIMGNEKISFTPLVGNAARDSGFTLSFIFVHPAPK